MAMAMRGEVALPVDRPTVWANLNDPQALKNCIGLIEAMEQTGDDSFAFLVRARVGPLRLAFRGRIVLSHVAPLRSYRIDAQGEGGLAGRARGHADVALSDLPNGTLLAYAVELDLGGRLAALGSRVMDGVARQAIDRFFAGFTRECLGGEARQGSPETAGSREPDRGRAPSAEAGLLPEGRGAEPPPGALPERRRGSRRSRSS